MKRKPDVWQCLEQLERETNNPRLVVIIERGDARHLLAVRAALKTLMTADITKRKLTIARRLLGPQWKEKV